MKQELSLSEIHAETLNMFKVIINICKDLGINCYLLYGTLLGAIREHGIIPWDDDFDIGMVRPDYEIFKDYCIKNSQVLKPYKLFDRDNVKNYPYTISRFCDTRYLLVDGHFDDVGMGLFIDIYPLDGAGNSKNEAANKLGGLRRFCLCRLVYNSIMPRYKASHVNFAHDIAHFIVYHLSHMIGKDRLLNRLDANKNAFDFEDSSYVADLAWISQIASIPKESLVNAIEVDFCGLRVKIQANYDEFLTEEYGDYMSRPPLEKQEPSHSYKLYRK